MYSQNPLETALAGISPAKKWYQHWWGKAIVIFCVIFLTIAAALAIYLAKVVVMLKSGEITPAQLFGQTASSTEPVVLPDLAALDDPNFGPKDAKVVVVEFADFTCSACQQAYPVVKEILKGYGDKILFVFRDFPSGADQTQAVLEAIAANCAWEQGKFWEMHDKLFANQGAVTDDSLKTYVIQLGLNAMQFSACLSSDKYLKEIEEDMTAGYDAGVRATPTFFINGVGVPGAIPLATFEQIIVSELSR